MNKDKNFPLPEDFQNYIQKNSPLYLCDFITIFSPLQKEEEVNLFTQIEYILEDLQDLKNQDKEYYKFELYPHKNGLLPFGVSDNGDYLFWQVCSKQSNKWRVAILPSRSNEVEILDESFLSFIKKLENKELVCNSFPKLF